MSETFGNPTVLKSIFNALSPSQPLPAGDSAYVDCRSVRGDGDIIDDLGKTIIKSNDATCQLYTGHRGSGKSTELKRLQKYLEDQDCFVVYFEADEEDVDPHYAEYIDILLSCTRRLLKDLKSVDANPLGNWLSDRCKDLKDLALMEISIDKFDIETSLAVFTKLTASIKAEPTQRAKIRDLLNPHSITLRDALNEFILEAKKKLPDGKTNLVMIVDNLDRIPIQIRHGARSNYEEIFLDRADQLQSLKCHLIYTVPIAFIYSKNANEVQTTYGNVPVLPMIPVRHSSEEPNHAGISKLKEALAKRILPHANMDLETQIFESGEALNELCMICGGQLRELLQLTQEAVKKADTLPIRTKAIRQAMSALRQVYNGSVETEDEWQLLVHVSKTKKLPSEHICRQLLHRRCVLEYRKSDDEGNVETWYDVHPLIKLIDRFKEESSKI